MTVAVVDLRFAPWIPFRRKSGVVVWASIACITDDLQGDPIVDVATARPDFDGALREFLIGILTAAFAPADEAEWHRIWCAPPTPDEIAERLSALPGAFCLDGDGPRFMQDAASDLGEEEVEAIQELLVNAKNSSLFVKQGQVRRMSRSAAAMALITIQTYSPAGGRGWRTSMRGGGPLTTLIDPRPPNADEIPLWERVWANVETREQLEGRGRNTIDDTRPESTYPWLGPTRTSRSEKDATTPDDAHPLQAYFGMPRRIQLVFEDVPGVCDVSGQPDERMVIGFRGKAYGINYVGWTHPLTPYYPGKSPNERLPVHGQPGGIGWRDWLSLTHFSSANPNRWSAAAVARFAEERARRIGRRSFSLHVYGYDANQAKIREWIDDRVPAFAVDSQKLQAVHSVVTALIGATDKAAYVLQQSVIRALHADEDAPGDTSSIKQELWRATQPWFYEHIGPLVEADDVIAHGAELKAKYLGHLAAEAEAVFDRLAPSDVTHPAVLRRTIAARFGLVMTLRHGGGKLGTQIHQALGLATAKERKQRAGKSNRKATRKLS